MLGHILKSPGFRKYFANTSWMMGEKFIRMGLNLFVGILVARYLGPSQFGLLSYAVSMVALFAVFGTLGLDDILTRNLVQEPADRDFLLGTSFFLRAVGSVFVFGAASFLSLVVSGDWTGTALVMIIAAGNVLLSFSVIQFFFLSEVRARYPSLALFASVVVSSVIKLILILVKASVVWFAWAIVTEYVILSIMLYHYYAMSGIRIRDWSFSGKTAVCLLKDSWPMIFSGLFAMVFTRVDQVMIKAILGNEAVGEYSIAVTMTEAWYVIPIVITTSLFPMIINARQTDQKIYHDRLQHLYDLTIWMGIGLAFVISLSSEWLVELLLGSAYGNSGRVLSILVWNLLFAYMSIMNSKWLVAENKQHILLFINPLGALLNVILNLILIPRLGILGAALATLLTQAITAHLIFAFIRNVSPVFQFHVRSFLIFFRLIKIRAS